MQIGQRENRIVLNIKQSTGSPRRSSDEAPTYKLPLRDRAPMADHTLRLFKISAASASSLLSPVLCKHGRYARTQTMLHVATINKVCCALPQAFPFTSKEKRYTAPNHPKQNQ